MSHKCPLWHTENDVSSQFLHMLAAATANLHMKALATPAGPPENQSWVNFIFNLKKDVQHHGPTAAQHESRSG